MVGLLQLEVLVPEEERRALPLRYEGTASGTASEVRACLLFFDRHQGCCSKIHSILVWSMGTDYRQQRESQNSHESG